MALVGAVNKYGHPMRAAVAFTAVAAVSAGLGMAGGIPLIAVALRIGISFVVAAAVFWLIDNVEGILSGVLVTVAGATALIALTWLRIS